MWEKSRHDLPGSGDRPACASALVDAIDDDDDDDDGGSHDVDNTGVLSHTRVCLVDDDTYMGDDDAHVDNSDAAADVVVRSAMF